MKKDTPKNQSTEGKRPKTTLDEKFLAIATEVMKVRGITSDRAISLELGRGPDFINKIRRGLQSATADAWEQLRTKYQVEPGTTVNQSQVTGIAVGVNHGVTAHTYTVADCEKERDEARSERDALKKENELLREQLAMKDAVIAAKEETIGLLRGGYNRPN